MRTRKFKTLRGWLDFIATRDARTRTQVYRPLNEFFAEELHFCYFSNFGKPDEKWHNEMVRTTWDVKYPIALAIVDFHWSRKSGRERRRIAVSLAKGEGDLSFLQSFNVSVEKTNGRWQYEYCTCGLSGPNYDWCKRKYLQSL